MTARHAPLVSVIVPAHNAEATLSETIDSIRRQTLSDFELIVIDDGSTDGTVQCVQRFDDPRIRVLSYPNGGLAVARNRGIEKSLGEFITFIDADDLWTPDKLELQVEALRRRPEALLATAGQRSSTEKETSSSPRSRAIWKATCTAIC